ncbi:hypothetical protein [Streptomyces sp. NPDC057287]|uniref:hypothetical protein n=1 Tax=Streptomyces sp. NPDC057287 TaxID=3346086 RepID=UPI003636A907
MRTLRRDRAREQPPAPDLRTRAVDRTVDLVTGDGLPVMRFAPADRRVVHDLRPGRENAFEKLAEPFEIPAGPDACVEGELRLRAALPSVGIVLTAARGPQASDGRIAALARAAPCVSGGFVPQSGRG